MCSCCFVGFVSCNWLVGGKEFQTRSTNYHPSCVAVSEDVKGVSGEVVLLMVLSYLVCIINVTHSHLRSKEPPGLHFVCSPASRATTRHFEVEIDCGDRLIHT